MKVFLPNILSAREAAPARPSPTDNQSGAYMSKCLAVSSEQMGLEAVDMR